MRGITVGSVPLWGGTEPAGIKGVNKITKNQLLCRGRVIVSLNLTQSNRIINA